jgi:hypothetical protein
MNDFLNSLVGAMIGNLELAVGTVLGIGPVLEAAVGQWSAEPLVKEQK